MNIINSLKRRPKRKIDHENLRTMQSRNWKKYKVTDPDGDSRLIEQISKQKIIKDGKPKEEKGREEEKEK